MAFIHAVDSDSPKAGKVEIDAVVVRETQRGVLIDYRGREMWLPRGRVVLEAASERVGHVVVLLPRWLAKAKGIV